MSVTPDSLAALCAAAMPDERLTAPELRRVCFGTGDSVVGDDDAVVVYTLQRRAEHVGVWIMLVVVHPARQGQGVGKELVVAALDAARAQGARTAHLANAVPRYLWPGVDLANTRAGMLFETLGFTRDLVGINMRIATTFRRDPPPGVVVERETGSGAHEFATRAYPAWNAELDVAVEQGAAFAARDSRTGATIGFGCHSCNREAWIGPMATDPNAQHRGIGSAVLGAVCADLEARRHEFGEIAWVSNLRFYGKCDATVSRVFQGGNLRLVTRAVMSPGQDANSAGAGTDASAP